VNAVCILIALVLTSLLRGCGPSSSNQEPAVNKINRGLRQRSRLQKHPYVDSWQENRNCYFGEPGWSASQSDQ